MYPVFNVGYLLETWDNSCGVTWVIFLYLQSSSRVQESTEHLLAFDISDTSPIGSKKETWQATNVIFKGLTIWLHLVFLVVLGVCVWVMVWHTRNHTNTWHLWQVKWSSRPVEVVSVWLLSGRPANMSECLRPLWEERLETSGEESRGRSHWNRLDKYIAWRIILPIKVCIFSGNPASHAITADIIFNYTHTRGEWAILDITSVPGRFYSTQHLSSKESPPHAQR